jgi:hypothetical protein
VTLALKRLEKNLEEHARFKALDDTVCYQTICTIAPQYGSSSCLINNHQLHVTSDTLYTIHLFLLFFMMFLLDMLHKIHVSHEEFNSLNRRIYIFKLFDK